MNPTQIIFGYAAIVITVLAMACLGLWLFAVALRDGLAASKSYEDGLRRADRSADVTWPRPVDTDRPFSNEFSNLIGEINHKLRTSAPPREIPSAYSASSAVKDSSPFSASDPAQSTPTSTASLPPAGALPAASNQGGVPPDPTRESQTPVGPRCVAAPNNPGPHPVSSHSPSAYSAYSAVKTPRPDLAPVATRVAPLCTMCKKAPAATAETSLCRDCLDSITTAALRLSLAFPSHTPVSNVKSPI